jgi:UDP-N-acetylmuramoylalanine--D-glutamate ligase
LTSAGVPTVMGGNIGVPILSQQPLPAGGVYVLELSSYQIDLTNSLDCDVALLLNISPDHLDRYDGFDAYAAAKARLFDMLGSGHTAIFASADEKSQLALHGLRALGRVKNIVDTSSREITGQPDWPSLQGPHNLQNTIAAIATVEALGITEALWRPALSSFAGLPHRMERVAESQGVLFVNDSKATNPASTAPALAAYPRVHWIVGGLPKGDDLDECAPHFGHVAAAYTIGEAGPRFAEILEAAMPVERCELLCEAVQRAIAAAKPGDVVLFSPACASFDQFRDYEQRGDSFRKFVAELTGASDGDPDVFTARSAA